MLTIPLQAVPNQTLTVSLGTQTTQINVYQTMFGLFVDVYVNNVLIIGGVIGENRNRIVRSAYLGFIGDLAFVDLNGTNDPVYTGFSERFILVYLEEADLQALGYAA